MCLGTLKIESILEYPCFDVPISEVPSLQDRIAIAGPGGSTIQRGSIYDNLYEKIHARLIFRNNSRCTTSLSRPIDVMQTYENFNISRKSCF